MYAAAPVSPTTTGLPTIHIDTNEGKTIDSNDTVAFLEGQFTITGRGRSQLRPDDRIADTRSRAAATTTWRGQEALQLQSLDKKANLCGMGGDKKWALLANRLSTAR